MNIKRSVVKRYRITGAFSEKRQMFDYCARKHLRVVVSGCPSFADNTLDTSRFGITAEARRD